MPSVEALNSNYEVLPLEPRWLRINQAEAYSNISKSKLYELMKEGKIRGISVPSNGKHRGCRLFDRLSIDAFMENQPVA
jgi:predicted DNA-binding transcriptional regulator AlpA